MGNNLGDLSLRGVPLHLRDDEAIPTKEEIARELRSRGRPAPYSVTLRSSFDYAAKGAAPLRVRDSSQ